MFKLGACVITPYARDFLDGASKTPLELLKGHHDGSLWGKNKEKNEIAVTQGERVFTSVTVDNVIVFIMTEPDRSSTCVMLASDY